MSRGPSRNVSVKQLPAGDLEVTCDGKKQLFGGLGAVGLSAAVSVFLVTNGVTVIWFYIVPALLIVIGLVAAFASKSWVTVVSHTGGVTNSEIRNLTRSSKDKVYNRSDFSRVDVFLNKPQRGVNNSWESGVVAVLKNGLDMQIAASDGPSQPGVAYAPMERAATQVAATVGVDLHYREDSQVNTVPLLTFEQITGRAPRTY